MNIDSIKQILNYILDNNVKLAENGEHKITVELIGDAGIGKTSIVEEVAAERGAKFVKINLAQLEETGDLVGIPSKEYCMYSPTGEEKWVTEKTINQFMNMGYTLCPDCEPHMSYAVPEWVPKDPEEEVILLLDDYRRANQLFMQATMELISRGEYISWQLPKKTQIVLTSNPDNGSYTVSSLDAAMESRFLSFNIEFDIKPWSFWADQVGLKSELINFALLNPEIFTRSLRINARSYSLFANACKSLSDLSTKESMNMLNLIAKGCFGDDGDYIGGLLIQFINNRLDKLMSAEDIVNKEFDAVIKDIRGNVIRDGYYRADVASVITTRLINYVTTTKDNKQIDKAIKRLEEIINHNEILLTEDLIFSLIKKMVAKYPAKCAKMLLNQKVKDKVLK